MRVSTSKPRALILQGGWPGHEPVLVADIFAGQLRAHGVDATVSDTLDSLLDEQTTGGLSLVVPIWTMSTITRPQLDSLLSLVKGGCGIAGVHGGMSDAFRNEPDYQYMVGGQWVAHPGGDGVLYTFHVEDHEHPVTAGSTDFEVRSEHYYMHVDPAVHVLGYTRFGEIRMPAAWTKPFGTGRVFYCSLGHQANIVSLPPVLSLVTRGMLWAARVLDESAPVMSPEALSRPAQESRPGT